MDNKYKKIKAENKKHQDDILKSIDQTLEVQKELKRVSEIGINANIILSDIDRQFEEATKLSKVDISFLFLGVALQVTRQFLQTNYLTKNSRLNDQEAAGEKKYNRENRESTLYTTTVQEIWSNPVPFDVQNGASNFGINLGGGNGHRYATAGHDPILGWLFGTANIATRTVTLTPSLQTYHVKYGNFLTKSGMQSLRPGDHFESKASTFLTLENSFIKPVTEPTGKNNLLILISALCMEAIHLKSDWNTKKSLALPFGNLNPDLANKMNDMGVDVASLITVGKQALFAELINQLVTLIHRMLIMSIEEVDNKLLLEVRSRKIVTYSNLISSGVNLGYVGLTKDMNKLDIGGFMVTLYKLISNKKFQKEVKKDFLEKEFYNLVMNG